MLVRISTTARVFNEKAYHNDRALCLYRAAEVVAAGENGVKATVKA